MRVYWHDEALQRQRLRQYNRTRYPVNAMFHSGCIFGNPRCGMTQVPGSCILESAIAMMSRALIPGTGKRKRRNPAERLDLGMASRSSSRNGGKSLRVIWFVVLEDLARDTGRLADYQRRIGLDTVWLESGIYHTAGFRLSEEVWQHSPFYDWRSRPELALHRRVRHVEEPRYPVLPGVLGEADDTDLRKVLDVAHGLGLEVWGHLGLWSYGSTAYPELGVRQIDGQFVPLEEATWGDCFCPNKPWVNHWVEECLRDVISRYDIDGMEIDHARYVPPASIPNLWVCACEDCARQAAAWGIDLGEMAEALKAGWARLRLQPTQAVLTAMDQAGTVLEALDTLLEDHLASRWFALRARHLSSALTRMASVSHKADHRPADHRPADRRPADHRPADRRPADRRPADRRPADRPFAFGIDVFPPSVAPLAGHSYGELGELDYLTGGVGMIGWGSAGPDACREWTRATCRQWPALDEWQVLRRLYRLFGYQGLALPPTTAALGEPDAKLQAMVAGHEIARMAQVRPAGLRIYAPVPVASMGEHASQVIQMAITQGMEGITLSGVEHLPPGVERLLSHYAREGGLDWKSGP
jgi:hypothetical protein